MYLLCFLIVVKTVFYVSITAVGKTTLPVYLITSIISILLLHMTALSNFKYKKMFLMLSYVFISSVMFVDVVYYLYFNELPSITLLGVAKQYGKRFKNRR